jgi:hypothetical protein
MSTFGWKMVPLFAPGHRLPPKSKVIFAAVTFHRVVLKPDSADGSDADLERCSRYNFKQKRSNMHRCPHCGNSHDPLILCMLLPLDGL